MNQDDDRDDGSPGDERVDGAGAGEFPAELLPPDVVDDLELVVPPEGGTVVFSDPFMVDPATDITYCTFQEGTTSEVMYVHDTLGTQSYYGHHAILYYTLEPQDPGTRDCGDMETMRQVLGGTGGEGQGGVVELPDNVVTEIPAGAQLVLNHHWINYGEEPKEVQAMLVTVPPKSTDDLIIARALAIAAVGWELAPGEMTTHTGECQAEADIPIIMAIGHEHEWGTQVKAERVGAEGKAEVIFDHPFTAEMTSNPRVFTYPVDDPLILRKGETLRMTCEWMNDTPEPITFPREMCVFFANTLASDDLTCVNGNWL